MPYFDFFMKSIARITVMRHVNTYTMSKSTRSDDGPTQTRMEKEKFS